MKILVTGTAGFIGFHLAKRLIERKDTVIGLDNINDYYDTKIKYGRLSETGIVKKNIEYNKLIQSKIFPNYKFIKLNLEDTDNINKLFKKEKFDKVCNLAAQAGVRYSVINPYLYINSNIVGFLNILETCRHNNIKHLVYASSSSVYGLNEQMPFSTYNNTDHPASIYAATKKSNELMAHAYSHLYNIPTTGLRFFTVYGPWGRPDMALFLFTKAILEDKPVNVFNYGNMRRDFTYIDDIVEAIEKVLDKPPQKNPEWDTKNPVPNSSKAPYKIYNVGNNNPVKLTDFIEIIEEILNKKARTELKPMQLGDVQANYADVSKLIEDFEYQPNTPIKKGVKNFINWYMDFYNYNSDTIVTKS